MEIFSHPNIEEIANLESNSYCFDCGFEKPKWASINNGIFLCLKCAGIHRNFPLNISLIRSLQIDSWDDKQILFLKKGGNEKFKKFLCEYDINEKSSIDLKYKSKAANYYRINLKNEIEKELNPNFIYEEIIKPDKKTGIEILEIKSNSNEISNDDLISSSNNNNIELQDESFLSFMGNIIKTTGSLILEKTKDLSKNLEEMNISEKLKDTGIGAINLLQKSGNYIAEKSSEVYNSNIIQGITHKAEEGINIIVDKTKSLLNQNEKKEDNSQNITANIKNETIENEEKKENI